MIRKVVYRTNNDTVSSNSDNWYGEDAYELGQRVMGKEITLIGQSYPEEYPMIRVFVGTPVRLFCEIPMTSVARIYYSLEDGE